MTIAEQIYAIAKTLPQDQADEILTFAEFIRAKYLIPFLYEAALNFVTLSFSSLCPLRLCGSFLFKFGASLYRIGINANQTVKNIDQLPWSEFVYSLAGTWKDDFPTLEEIRTELGQDILRESL